jgi:hypothetical protein
MANNTAVNKLKAWVAARREELLGGGIATIIARYSGEGDQGWLDQDIDFLTGDVNAAKPFELDALETLRPLFEALHDELAPPGYENDDGGGGEFTLNVATGVLTHESYFFCTERSYNAAEAY